MSPPRRRAGSARRALALILPSLLTLASASAQARWADVEAILTERCTICHAGDAAPSGLRLTDHEAVMTGGSDGAVVIPGDPDGSELVRRIRGDSLPRMPLTGPPFLDEEQILTIATWIAEGAAGPDAGRPSPEGEAGPAAPPAPGTFAAVEPIFLRSCVTCHARDGAMGAPPEGLVLSTYEAILAGGERVVVVPGEPLASELYRRVEGWARPRMPWNGPPLHPDEVRAIHRWIEAGAPAPDGEEAALPVGREVRLHGTLGPGWRLDGLPLVVDDDTRVDDDPNDGDYVEVRGVVTPAGGILVERIRPR